MDLTTSLSTQHGSVRNISIPSHKSSGKIVIHIQDVHLNQEAQTNIAHVIKNLIQENEVGLLAVEGAFSSMDLSGFHQFSDQALIKKSAEYLLKEAQISGPLYAALTTATYPKPHPSLVGVDDATHYEANASAYRQSAPLVKPYQDKLAGVIKHLTNQKNKTFNPQLMAFDRKVEAYAANELPIGAYITHLTKSSQSNPEELRLFMEALEMERDLNFTRIETERLRLIARLVEKMKETQTSELLNVSAAYKMGRIRHGDFYTYLHRLCAQSGVDLSQAPSLSAYIQYVLLTEKIDPEKTAQAIKKLETIIYTSLVQTKEEERLVQASRQLFLTSKLLAFALTPQEWNEYASNTQHIIFPDNLSTFENFYKEALVRDQKMAANLIQAIKNSNAQVAVLVTGGFHANGMNNLMENAGITTISFVPQITKIETETATAYLNVFTQQKTPLENLFHGEKLFLQPPQTPGLQKAVLITASQNSNPGQTMARLAPGSNLKATKQLRLGNTIETIWENLRTGASTVVGIVFTANNDIARVSVDAPTPLTSFSMSVSQKIRTFINYFRSPSQTFLPSSIAYMVFLLNTPGEPSTKEKWALGVGGAFVEWTGLIFTMFLLRTFLNPGEIGTTLAVVTSWLITLGFFGLTHSLLQDMFEYREMFYPNSAWHQTFVVMSYFAASLLIQNNMIWAVIPLVVHLGSDIWRLNLLARPDAKATSNDEPEDKFAQVRDSFARELRESIAGSKNSLLSLQTFAQQPTGQETGRFISINWGGTNGSLMEVTLEGRGKYKKGREIKFAFTPEHLANPGTAFDVIADKVIELIQNDRESIIGIGFIFSYPMEQTALNAGILVRWNKGWRDPENGEKIVGQDVAAILNNRLEKRGFGNVKVKALANDTLNPTVVYNYEKLGINPNATKSDIGTILGTGHNTAIYIDGNLLNLESGNFNGVEPAQYEIDHILNSSVQDPPSGRQWLEKMTAGKYLPEILRLTILYLTKKGDSHFSWATDSFLKEPFILNGEDIALFATDVSNNLELTKSFFGERGVTGISNEDLRLIRSISWNITRRSAYLIAAEFAGALKVMDPHLERDHVIAVEGSLFNKNPFYVDMVTEGIQNLLGDKAHHVQFVSMEGAEGVGAAILAATASQPQTPAAEQVAQNIAQAETGADGRSTPPHGLEPMMRVRDFSREKNETFAYVWKLGLNNLSNHFRDFGTALRTAFDMSPRGPVLIFVNENSAEMIIEVETTFREMARQNRRWWNRLAASITGSKSYALAILSPSMANDTGAKMLLESVRTKYDGRVASAQMVASVDFVARADGYHYEDLFEAFSKSPALINHRDTLATLSKGDSNIGTRIIQINEPQEVYRGKENILALIVLLIPQQMKTILLDIQAILFASKMA